MKKQLSIIVAVFAVFAMTAVSFAANTAQLNITSEPIRQFAPCDKAGGIVGTFDPNTTFRGGDQITFDLDFGVTLCKTIDFEAGMANPAGPHVFPIGWTGAAVADYAFSTIGATVNCSPAGEFAVEPFQSHAGGFLDNPVATEGILFYVHGNAGSARVTIDIMTFDNTLVGDARWGYDPTIVATFNSTLTADPTNARMQFAFLDGADYCTTARVDFYKPDATGDYTISTDVADNTLCINVSQMPAAITTFDGNFDSKDDKFTWIPSDPQIAHVAEANSFVFEECKDRNPGRTLCPGTASQFSGAECVPIENESDAINGSNGFCYNDVNDYHFNNKMIIRTLNNTPFDQINYDLELTILVNGVAGNSGAYWSNDPILTQGYNTKSEACDATNGDGSPIGGTPVYRNASGVLGTAAADTDCTVDTANQVITVQTTTGTDLNLSGANDYLYINLPRIIRTSDLVEGVLSVRVTLKKAPCGAVFTGEWKIGDICCEDTPQSGNLLYPYFARSNGDFVNVVIVDNVTSVAGTATLYAYEDDGDQWMVSGIAVDAYGMYVAALNSIAWVNVVNGGAGTPVFGDARCWIKVNALFGADGAAWVVNPDSGESFGYICRKM